jgi:hypothetical protein
VTVSSGQFGGARDRFLEERGLTQLHGGDSQDSSLHTAGARSIRSSIRTVPRGVVGNRTLVSRMNGVLGSLPDYSREVGIASRKSRAVVGTALLATATVRARTVVALRAVLGSVDLALAERAF